jgi:hypothetical protein
LENVLMKKTIIAICCIVLSSCSGPMRLTDTERSKLDPSLAKLVQGESVNESDYDANLRSDGAKEYSVIIRSNNVDDLKSAGIRVGSTVNDIITARVTIQELRKILGINSVRVVQNSAKSYPQ